MADTGSIKNLPFQTLLIIICLQLYHTKDPKQCANKGACALVIEVAGRSNGPAKDGSMKHANEEER